MWLLLLLWTTFADAQGIKFDKSFFKMIAGASHIVLVNGGESGYVIPCIDGVDIVRETNVDRKKAALIATLKPGEQASVSIRAPHPRTIHVVFKQFAPDGVFIGATAPKRIDIPALPETIEESVVFAPSQLKGSLAR